MEYKVLIGGVEYGMNSIASVTIERPLFPKFSAGNACAAELDITFWPSEKVPRMAQIVPYCRESSEDDWTCLGTFYVDERAKEAFGRQTLIAYDSMLKADVVWEPDQSLVFPLKMPDAVVEIAALMGVDVDPRTVLNTSYTIDYPANEYTMRDVLEGIAAANLGNWIITKENKLLLVPLFGSMPEETRYLVTEDGSAITFGGVRILV